jgi:hypothetical protein
MTQDKAFKAWWYSEGSQPPYTHHDCEEHTMRMCEIAWANGADKEKERIIKVIERLGTWAHIHEIVSEIKGEQA